LLGFHFMLNLESSIGFAVDASLFLREALGPGFALAT
jgi:hypothetical protein